MNARELLGKARELRRKHMQDWDELIEQIETEPGANAANLIDQHQSKMSVRRHCSAVRRRRAEGKPGAFISGRLYLLTPEAHQEELDFGSPERPGLASATDADEDAAYRELLLKMGRTSQTRPTNDA